MKQLNFPGIKPKPENIKSRSVILSERDYQIIEYVLDMKFATVQDVFEKFFKVTLSNEPAKSDEWAVRRLQQLSKAGYLKPIHSFSERRKYYLGTVKGYSILEKVKPEADVSKPVKGIDHHTFDHDKKVIEARIILENQRAATSWISDKKLRSNKDLAGGLLLSNVPDGLFKTPEGKRIALEVEATTKTKAIYQSKIKKYVSMMRSKDTKVNVFDKVLYVVAKPWVIDFLSKETKIYGELFEIVSWQDFFGGTSGERS
ncbi:replication-relaxation family protein [Bdellovibrio sp. NC01]|uniref:replication-relaxation family protein n=1 Tax=Bdellovibrio sp. NC01 TaxID=2220073 RepID=UPI001157DBA5|nr:replication-relaxation family protein [Bdellovibrio sp. NC01]QDK37979.1 hypothetical protein DOE51_10450 [Bdellovibrio sp. NC01]